MERVSFVGRDVFIMNFKTLFLNDLLASKVNTVAFLGSKNETEIALGHTHLNIGEAEVFY